MNQDYPHEKLQIIVVDNGSDYDLDDIVRLFSDVTLLREAGPGSYRARNKGLRNARGDYVAFIDSDCEASSQWLTAALSVACNTPNLGIVAGRIELVVPAQRTGSAAALYESLFAFNQRQNAASGLCVTANWLSPRTILDHLDGFNAALQSGADTALARRITLAGYEVVYSDLAVVKHSARTWLGELRAKRRRLVGGRWIGLGCQQRQLPALLLAVTKGFGGEVKYNILRSHLTPAQKFKVFGVIVALWLTAILEIMRLGLGGRARRA